MSILGTYLGQNFLTDSKVRHWICDTTQQLYTASGATSLVEIGPGKGAITKLIKDISPDFTVIEKDQTMLTGLQELLGGNGQIVLRDVLESSIVSEKERPFVVGNLPYYITSPILRKFFATPVSSKKKSSDEQIFPVVGGLFMIQKEVGEKIASDAKKKSYLYWLLNYAYEVDYLKTVPPKAFTPPPKVYSCLISLKKKQKAELPQISFSDLITFLDLVAPYPRKTLGAIMTLLKKQHVHDTTLLAWMQSLQCEELAKKRLEELNREELSSLSPSATL